MICTACGKENVDSSAFCEHCGARMQAQPATTPGTAAPGPIPVVVSPPPAAQVPQVSALIASLSMGEKVAGGGAVAAVVGFFLPWVSATGLGASANGLDLAKASGAVYLILLFAIAAGVLCYLSSKAAPGQKLMYAGYLVFLGAICGPVDMLGLLFVSQVQSVAGIGSWLLGLGYIAIAVGGLMTIRDFSKRTY